MNAPPDQLAFHIHTYLPGAEGEALKLRISLLKARDYAAALRGSSVSRVSQDHAADAHDLAGAMVFKEGASEVKLKAAVDYCRAVIKAAMLAEILDETGG